MLSPTSAPNVSILTQLFLSFFFGSASAILTIFMFFKLNLQNNILIFINIYKPETRFFEKTGFLVLMGENRSKHRCDRVFLNFPNLSLYQEPIFDCNCPDSEHSGMIRNENKSAIADTEITQLACQFVRSQRLSASR
ncbi:MAG TPA: hypothetical protein DCY88_29095 [Cyanobacteria bacterium UBA11372]|nr:hypothetical protein [Cyanobacteria bacterium UBA11372]HBE51681.1 hypothetical protein [Cyanobacteria bacterium UBA11369]